MLRLFACASFILLLAACTSTTDNPGTDDGGMSSESLEAFVGDWVPTRLTFESECTNDVIEDPDFRMEMRRGSSSALEFHEFVMDKETCVTRLSFQNGVAMLAGEQKFTSSTLRLVGDDGLMETGTQSASDCDKDYSVTYKRK
jgi:hypothetical protein